VGLAGSTRFFPQKFGLSQLNKKGGEGEKNKKLTRLDGNLVTQFARKAG